MIQSGDTFDDLTVQWFWKRQKRKGKVWKCTCQCGGYCYVKETALTQRIIKNCGHCQK